MTTITNNSKRRLGLSGRPSLVLRPGETSEEITAGRFTSFCNNKTTVRWIASGLLTVNDPPEGVVDLPDLSKPSEVKGKSDTKEVKDELELPEGITGEGKELHQVSRGQYDVYINGFKVTDETVSKKKAGEIMDEYEDA